MRETAIMRTSGFYVDYRGQSFRRAGSSSSWVMLGMSYPEWEVFTSDDEIERGIASSRHPWVKVPIEAVDRLYRLEVTAKLHGLDVDVSAVEPDRIWVSTWDKAVADALGFVGTQFDGWHGQTRAEELAEVTEREFPAEAGQ